MILEYVSRKENEISKTKQEVIDMLPELLLQRGKAKDKRIAEIYWKS